MGRINKKYQLVEPKHGVVMHVTSGDAAASPNDPTQCAMARCLVRSFPGVEKVEVMRTVAHIFTSDGREVRLATSAALRDEIARFDDLGLPFRPGAYELLPLLPHQKRAGRKKNNMRYRLGLTKAHPARRNKQKTHSPRNLSLRQFNLRALRAR